MCYCFSNLVDWIIELLNFPLLFLNSHLFLSIPSLSISYYINLVLKPLFFFPKPPIPQNYLLFFLTFIVFYALIFLEDRIVSCFPYYFVFLIFIILKKYSCHWYSSSYLFITDCKSYVIFGTRIWLSFPHLHFSLNAA